MTDWRDDESRAPLPENTAIPVGKHAAPLHGIMGHRPAAKCSATECFATI